VTKSKSPLAPGRGIATKLEAEAETETKGGKEKDLKPRKDEIRSDEYLRQH